jgi:hypothetical protein
LSCLSEHVQSSSKQTGATHFILSCLRENVQSSSKKAGATHSNLSSLSKNVITAFAHIRVLAFSLAPPNSEALILVLIESHDDEDPMLWGEFHDQGDAKWIVIRGHLRGHNDILVRRPTPRRPISLLGVSYPQGLSSVFSY